MPELRITIVVVDDLDTEEVEVRVMGETMLPGPIRKRTFEEAWTEMGVKLAGYRAAPPKRWA